MYSTYTKADAYLDPLLVTEVSAETMDSYIHLKKIKETVILFSNLFRQGNQMLKVHLTFYGGRDFTLYFCAADSKPKYDTRCANKEI